METAIRDIRYALRTLRKSPGFAAVAVLSLALGIGANTAIFSVHNSIFLRSLPVEAPEELIEISMASDDSEWEPFSYPAYLDLAEQTGDVLSGVMTYDISVGVLEHGEGSEFIFGEAVSGNYFTVLGIEPTMGRAFIQGTDDAEGATPTVVVSHESWQNRFGADPDLVGSSLRINGLDYEIIGIAPKGFKGMLPLSSEVWVPLVHDPLLGGGLADLYDRKTQFLFSVKGRLQPGVEFETARAAVATVGERLAQAYPETNEGIRITAVPASDVGIHPLFDAPIRMLSLFLMVMVGLALLVACTNLAGMLLARASARRREIAVRLSIGSGRWRLIRQLVTESILLAAIGGIVGLGIAYLLIRALLAFQPPVLFPVNLNIQLDSGVLLFTAIVTLLTGVVFGLIPALQSTRLSLVSALKNEMSVIRGRFGRLNLRNTLVVAQVTISVLLLICTGLFMRSLANASAIDPGFELRRGVVSVFDTVVRGYTEQEGRTFFAQLRSRVGAMPGVESTALISSLPMGPGILTTTVIPDLPGLNQEEDGLQVDINTISENYFNTMGIELLAGRDFTPGDTPESRQVVIINETLSQRLWPGESAVGRRLRIRTEGDTAWEVVGIARNGKYRTLGEEPRGFVYLPYSQSFTHRVSLVASTAGDPRALFPAIREEVRTLDPNLPIFELKTVSEHMEIMLFVPRLMAVLLGGLGLLALFLGIIGLYGIISFDVARRTREVGIRMALGARRTDVLRQVIGEGVRITGIGIILGLVLSFLLTRMLTSLLFGINPVDPVTFGGITLTLLAVSIAAAYGPARRASSLDPMTALRHE